MKQWRIIIKLKFVIENMIFCDIVFFLIFFYIFLPFLLFFYVYIVFAMFFIAKFVFREVFLVKYEINDETLAIISLDENSSKIVEKSEEYVVNESVYSIMEHSCKYFGSSLSGRIDGSKDILGSVYKIPIIVEESQKLIFFPTESLSSEKVSWISYKNIKNIKKYGKKSIIMFENGNDIVVNCPYFSLKNQIFRCNMLDAISSNRKSNKKNG